MMTRDIGLAIRDLLENSIISQFKEEGDDLVEYDGAARVDYIDVSDADNPIVHLDTGHIFQIRIFRA